MSSRRIANYNAKKQLLKQYDQEQQQLQEQQDQEQATLANKGRNKNGTHNTKVKTKANVIPIDHDDHFESNKVLSLYKDCFNEMFEDLELLNEKIQSVKSHLFERQYLEAFGTEINRSAYVVRWSPSRSLAYASLFTYLQPVRRLLTDLSNEDEVKVLCVGGGAGSELVAFASCFCKARESFTSSAKKLQLQLVDIADWSDVIMKINQHVNERWIYKEHIPAGKDVSSVFDAQFQNQDILKMTTPEIVLPDLQLITLLFTTNELFKADKSASIQFLNNLNRHCSKGCLLLITESAGSYSEIAIGSKLFPIQYLIDLILVGKPGETKNSDKWEIIDQNDSIWYRLESDLEYDLKLENMRFFYRLYRKL